MSINSNIEALLNKYWEGESSLEDEAQLKSYFGSNNVHPDHEDYKDLFVFFGEESGLTSSLNLESGTKLLNSTTPVAKTISLTRRLMSVAAIGIVLFSAFWLYQSTEDNIKGTNSAYVHEVEDAEEALRITKDALAFLSVKFDKSSNTIHDNVKKIKAVNSIK